MYSSYSFLAVGALMLATLTANAEVIQECRPGTWAVTYDDGPHTQLTPKLLDDLKAEGVKATFFVLGQMVALAPALLKRAYDEGHQIASHTYTHPSLSKLAKANQILEMQSTDAEIVKAIGVRPAYMRPPYGECDAACEKLMDEMGYVNTLWNTDSVDWNKTNTADRLMHNILHLDDGNGRAVKKTDGIISLQHDIQPLSMSLARKIIQRIKKLGFKFSTVAECADNLRPPYRTVDGAPIPRGANGGAPIPRGADGAPIPRGADGAPILYGADGAPIPRGEAPAVIPDVAHPIVPIEEAGAPSREEKLNVKNDAMAVIPATGTLGAAVVAIIALLNQY